ncbi:MAG: C-terminal binding protein [Acidaminococcaceae bacterium]|nr:C-terminal binding protein [Acidaminococcaceae bacterium]
MKVIITDCDHGSVEIERDILQNAGIENKLLQCHTEDDLISQCGNTEILINQYAPISEKVIRSLPELKLVIRYGVGVDNIDIKAATYHGVRVCNVPDYGVNEVAEQAMALMLCLLKKILIMSAYTKSGKWDYTKSIPIHRFNQLTIGIVGIGRIGSNFAAKVHALGCRIIVFDPYITNDKNKTDYIELTSFDSLLHDADVISIHCPLENARNLFDASAFRKMKKSAYLINTARGGIVNEKDLDNALEEGELAGAALDCMNDEPVTSNPLFRHENFIPTPHMSWYSEEAYKELKSKVAEEAVRYFKGESLRNLLN